MPDYKLIFFGATAAGLIGLTLLGVAATEATVPHVDPDQPAPTPIARANASTTVSAVRFAAYNMPVLLPGK